MSEQTLHNAEQGYFYVQLDNNEQATLKYQMLDDQSVDFYSTFVPTSQRGKGLAARLVEFGFEWAKQNNLEINASCSYASAVLERSEQREN